MSGSKTTQYVVVGVVQGQADAVVRDAARFAQMFGAQLVCAHVDTTRYAVQDHEDGTVTSMPFDPDLPEVGESIFDPDHEQEIRTLLKGLPVQLHFRELAGETVRALARLAEVMEAELIIVGSRHGGLRSGLKEFFSGSIAAGLAHRQPRPVVVIPQSPVTDEGALPWEKPETPS